MVIALTAAYNMALGKHATHSYYRHLFKNFLSKLHDTDEATMVEEF